MWHNNDFRFNVLMSDGSVGNLVHSKKQEIKMASQQQVAKIVFYWNEEYSCILGCRFYDKNNQVLLEFGRLFDQKSFEITLNDGERVLGLKSRLTQDGDPRHEDP